MKSAIVTLATEETATRRIVSALANGLIETGRSATLVWVSENAEHHIGPPPVVPGVETLKISPTAGGRRFMPDVPLFDLTRQIGPRLRTFDVVYGFMSKHPAIHAIRERRHSRRVAPYFVTVIDRALRQRISGLDANAIGREFGELYVRSRCDLAVSFDDHEPLTASGETALTPRLLRADIAQLSGLFDAVEDGARAAASRRAVREDHAAQGRTPSLTICVSHTERSDSPVRVLHALARQTSRDFTVIVVASSTSSLSAAALAAFARQYRERDWIFRREPQSNEARAVALSVADTTSDFLMFIDANDAPQPDMVERSLLAARLSGDDLLEIWSSEGEHSGDSLQEQNDYAQAGIVRASYGLDPINALAGNLDPSPVFLVRREAFVSVGGYPNHLTPGGERQALAVRIAAAGYRTDVLPEILNVRRMTTAAPHDVFLEGEALRRAFDEPLNPINMQSFAAAFQSVAQQLRNSEKEMKARQRELEGRFPSSRKRERLRLLMVVSSLPYPPISGCLLRWWAIIRFLGQRHDLTLVTFCSREQSRQRHELLRYCRSIYAAAEGGAELPVAEGMPYLVRLRMRATMRDALRAIPSDLYDAALIEQIFLAPFADEISAPAVLGEHNIESQLLAQAAQTHLLAPPTDSFADSQYQSKLMRDYEDRIWPQFAMRSAVNAQERDEIQRRSKVGNTILAENGTTSDLWLENITADTGRIIFFGMLAYYPNIDGVLYFWRDIWPHVVRRRPSLQLIVAGSGATKELRTLAKQPGFILIEDPSDIRNAAASASVSIVPLRLGSGTRLKILDSMALGLPVVTTRLGCSGLATEDGNHLLIRDDPREFAEAIAELLASPSLWRKLRENGRAAVEERYRWEKVLSPLESALWNMAS